jgi:hypothetical protein
MAESFVCAGAMQSSVRAETARVADLKGLSSTSVRVNRKVTVVSSTSPTPVVKRGKYSHMPSVPNDHSRPQTSPSPANVTAVDAHPCIGGIRRERRILIGRRYGIREPGHSRLLKM